MLEKYKLMLMAALFCLSAVILGVNLLQNRSILGSLGAINEDFTLEPSESDQNWDSNYFRNLSPVSEEIANENVAAEPPTENEQERETSSPESKLQLLNSTERRKEILNIESKTFGGTWSLNEQKDRARLSSHLNNIKGIVKSKLVYHKEGATLPELKLDSTLHDGKYRDQVIYLKVFFEEIYIRTDNNTIVVNHKNASVEVSYGRLYSITQDHNCQADIQGNFDFSDLKNIKSNIVLTSDGSCFPEKLTFDLEYPNKFAISKRRVFNYVIILSCLLIGYCYVTNKQCYEAEQNQAIANRISMTTLSWNTIWNFCLFNIYLSYALQLQDYGYFAISACMYFILCFIFELKLLLICWKAKNIELFSQGNEAVRRALITFYIKFYLIALMSLLTLERIIGSNITLFLLCGSTLFPQIIENAINKSRNTPSMLYATAMMVTQCFFAVYIKGCSSNVMELKSDYKWTIYFVSYVVFQIFFLYLQRKFGSRFFIPKFCRFWDEYNYYKNFNEDLEEGNNSDGGLTCCICLNPLTFSEEGETQVDSQTRSGISRFLFRRTTTDSSSNMYMKTPCGHKYHPSCLKAWMRRKLECPFCRTSIPALDEEEE
ncbi:unnamed protein product [Moneuplotes crassus]|uniref:RING-type E3 ubiquitin transferase n=1 Tax=Euplotes crassus TaxID=5936 RepID=A0AAD1Y4Z4_EUPCR|nr:unnamed protein product [Moneuplotes crassus]